MPKIVAFMALAIAFMVTGLAGPSYAEEEKQVCCHFLVQPEKGGSTPGCMMVNASEVKEMCNSHKGQDHCNIKLDKRGKEILIKTSCRDMGEKKCQRSRTAGKYSVQGKCR